MRRRRARRLEAHGAEVARVLRVLWVALRRQRWGEEYDTDDRYTQHVELARSGFAGLALARRTLDERRMVEHGDDDIRVRAGLLASSSSKGSIVAAAIR
jgi:hypothetical protein